MIAQWLERLRPRLEVERAFRIDRARLMDLCVRYEAFGGPPCDQGSWADAYERSDVDPRRFRGEGAFLPDRAEGNHRWTLLRTARYLANLDRGGLLARMPEDGAFRVRVVPSPIGLVSRDRLDAFAEIEFIADRVPLDQPGFRVIDIGAGYGRLTLRLVQAFDAIEVVAVDPIPMSTAIAEGYLAARGAGPRARVVPIDELDAEIARRPPDLALFVHVTSEMPTAAVSWWLARLVGAGVTWLFVVPNADDHGGTRLLSAQGADLLPVFATSGYDLVDQRAKYEDRTMQRRGVSPTTYYLFKRAS